MPYIHHIRVRYGECDQQGVVFNPNYMVYMDDAGENWVSSLAPSGNFLDLGWDWMVVRSVIEWQAPAHHGETLSIDVAIVRYGSTSFEIGYVGTVGRARGVQGAQRVREREGRHHREVRHAAAHQRVARSGGILGRAELM